jgi:hypothetical protein
MAMPLRMESRGEYDTHCGGDSAPERLISRQVCVKTGRTMVEFSSANIMTSI